VLPKVEVRHLNAVIALAEELNFTRAAHKLHITQPALSRQITELEERHRLHLFARRKGRAVELTDAGRIFVEEARCALLHTDRAVQLARVADQGSNRVLTIGHSPCADPDWISAILAIRLTRYPKLRVRLVSQFPIELVRSVLGGELNLALVVAPPEDSQMTAVPFDRSQLCAAVSEPHPGARKESLALQDLAKDEWILFSNRVHPVLHDAIIEAARCESIIPKDVHDVLTAQQALHLVAEHVGVAILVKPAACSLPEGVVLKPLSDPLWFDTCVVMRANDDSKLVNEFARTFLRQYPLPVLLPKQMELSLSA
jgi:DNA-binding transcriptional LysR family regulator